MDLSLEPRSGDGDGTLTGTRAQEEECRDREMLLLAVAALGINFLGTCLNGSFCFFRSLTGGVAELVRFQVP